MHRMTLSSLFFCIAASGMVQASEIHIIHCLNGCPTGAPASNDLVISHIYALSSNDTTKFADWVAYQVTSETIGTSQSLNRDWVADPNLAGNETLEPRDYIGAAAALSIDRGHMAPLAAFAGTPFWRETNILSNIAPQIADLNQGAWENLESKVRDVAYQLRQVWVVTGPLYETPQGTMVLPQADEPHHIPSGYWTVISTESGRLTGFIFGQDTPRDASYCDYIRPLTEIESRSHLDLFPNAPVGWGSTSLKMELGCS